MRDPTRRVVRLALALATAVAGPQIVVACSTFGEDATDPTGEGGALAEGSADHDGPSSRDAGADVALGSPCDGGTCLPVLLATGLQPARRIASGTSVVYYAETAGSGSVQQVSKKGGASTPLAQNVGARGLAFAKQTLFVTSATRGVEARNTDDGGVIATTSIDNATDVVADSTGLAVLGVQGAYVMNAMLDVQPLQATGTNAIAIAIDDASVYVAFSGKNTITRASRGSAGASMSSPPVGVSDFSALDVDGSVIYFASANVLYAQPLEFSKASFTVHAFTAIESISTINSGPTYTFVTTADLNTETSYIYRFAASPSPGPRVPDLIATLKSCEVQDVGVDVDALYVLCLASTQSGPQMSSIYRVDRP